MAEDQPPRIDPARAIRPPRRDDRPPAERRKPPAPRKPHPTRDPRRRVDEYAR